ncbi:MAG: hypothetical protein FWC69_03730 [Defluviitaleaceae bacterium]|nr:hypothetical protein [Defluviitaleaceae bacterium]
MKQKLKVLTTALVISTMFIASMLNLDLRASDQHAQYSEESLEGIVRHETIILQQEESFSIGIWIPEHYSIKTTSLVERKNISPYSGEIKIHAPNTNLISSLDEHSAEIYRGDALLFMNGSAEVFKSYHKYENSIIIAWAPLDEMIDSLGLDGIEDLSAICPQHMFETMQILPRAGFVLTHHFFSGPTSYGMTVSNQSTHLVSVMAVTTGVRSDGSAYRGTHLFGALSPGQGEANMGMTGSSGAMGQTVASLSILYTVTFWTAGGYTSTAGDVIFNPFYGMMPFNSKNNTD